jgi:DNA-binding NarL/FixJ family response regulator
MSIANDRRKQFLLVDDDAGFLHGIKEIFSQMANGSWDIFTAENHSQALDVLRQQPVNVVVLDLDMPVMDGLQFLRLLGRTHPGQQVVILTGHATDESRKACLESGAALVLEKTIAPNGFASVFSALDALAGAVPQEGFRGLMRRVGLPEVLQMECLSHKSSVLEVFGGKTRGRIYISNGSIVHADSGQLQGEVALYSLLALRGGEFNFLPFTEPLHRTITGHWESLLMEAARLSDAGTQFFQPEVAVPDPSDQTEILPRPRESAPRPGLPERPKEVRIEEVILCSGSGEVVYEWECKSLERRLQLLQQIEQQGNQIAALGPLGRFDRLELSGADERIVCDVQSNRRLFVRSRSTPPQAP